eukprot:m.58415 g.58415  ORF g.58415 m.58415 type:complete len:427 (+) comp9410_c0_seq1:167-1447(+)
MDAKRELETEDAKRKRESTELLTYLKQTETAGDAIRCPICKTSGKFRPTLILYVSEKCGHEMCDSCLGRRYEAKATAECSEPKCTQKKLLRANYKEKRFINGMMHLEMSVRERMAKVFCETRKDFDTEADYDAYLETIERLAFDQIHGDPEAAQAAQAEIDEYVKKMAHVIDERQREAKYSSFRANPLPLSVRPPVPRPRFRRLIQLLPSASPLPCWGGMRRNDVSLDNCSRPLGRASESLRACSHVGGRYDRKRKRDEVQAERVKTEAKRQENKVKKAKDRAETKREKDRLKGQLLRTTNRDDVKRILEELRALKHRKLNQREDEHIAEEPDSEEEDIFAAAAAAAAPVPEDYPLYVYQKVVMSQPRQGPLAPPTPMLLPQLEALSICVGEKEDATTLPYIGATGHRPKDIAKRALDDAFSCLFS